MTQPSAGATHWNKPSVSRFCERSAKPIGLSEALRERQLAWASRGRRWHTRCKSWGSLALHVRGGGRVYQNGGPPFADPSPRLSLFSDHLRTVLAVKGPLR